MINQEGVSRRGADEEWTRLYMATPTIEDVEQECVNFKIWNTKCIIDGLIVIYRDLS